MSETQNTKKSSPVLIIVLIIVLVLAAAGVGGYFFFGSKYKTEAINSFTFFMDHAFGQDGWRAAGYDFSLTGKTLTADKVTINPSKLDLSAKGEVVFGSIEIVNGLLKDDLSNLLKLKDWQSQPDTHLADRVTMKALSIKEPEESGSETVLTTDEITLTGLDLVSAPANNGTGLLSFIKSSRLGKLVINNVNINGIKDGNKLALHLGKVEDTDLRLGQNLESLDDPIALLTSYSVKESILEDLSFEFAENSDKGSIIFKIKQHALSNVSKLSIGQYSLKDVLFELFSTEIGYPVKFSMAELTINNIDLLPLVDRFTEALNNFNANEEEDSSESLYKLYSKLYRISDFFAMPYSFEGATLSEAFFSIDTLAMSFNKVDVHGPFEANKIPPSSSFSLQGFNVTLPDNVNHPKFGEIAQFAQDFGQKEFSLSYNIQSSYDPKTGTLTYNYSPLAKADNLATININFTITNLTTNMAERMAKIPMDETEKLLEDPEISNLGLSHLKIEVIDQSLTNKLIKFLAIKNSQDPEIFRQSIELYLEFQFEQLLAENLETSALISTALLNFVKKPETIAIELAPSQPLSMSSSLADNFDIPTIFNSLNGTLTVNSALPVPIKFLPTPEESQPQGDETLEDLDLEELLGPEE
jgi:hypothetical protein